MPEYKVAIQVIRVFNLIIEAEDEDDAIGRAYDMNVREIIEQGTLKDVETGHAEIMN